MSDGGIPADGLRQRLTMSGLEYLRGLAGGEIPPSGMYAAMGFHLEEIAEGRVVMTGRVQDRFTNGIGMVHGGYAATLLDSAMGSAVNSTTPAGRLFTTLEMKVNYVRALRLEVGTVRCEAAVLHVGGRTATAEGRVLDTDGRLYAHGTTTYMLYRG